MSQKTVGALTIGQSPRPDLVSPLQDRLPEGVRIQEAGALDGLLPSAMPGAHNAAYPLTTRLREGTVVTVGEEFLINPLQTAIEGLEQQDVAAILLLCAGTFASLTSVRPLFKPFALAAAEARTRGWQSLGLMTPISSQINPIRQRWLNAGFRPTVWTADLTHQDDNFQTNLQQRIAQHRLEAIVLDYVGHPPSLVQQLQQNTGIPVLDLGQWAITVFVEALEGRSR